jgi:asparagine synthase (glutamine-hydrolysing)
MCGIGGTARLDGQDLGPEADAVLATLADVLQHRGPDDRELLRDGPVGLAFTRLSLVDPADGSQPLISDDGNLVLIANGEVYNHKELAAALPGDVRLKTGSDCEVLLYLYRQHGLDFLRDVRGMFGIILWDRRARQLILARDRFGIKPLYYHRNPTRIVLSSEIKGLFVDPGTPRRFDWERSLSLPSLAVAPQFSASSVSTWFEGVESVPAASVLRIDLGDGRTTSHRYWEMPTEPDESTTADGFVERYGELLTQSVGECATADTEIGLFLSGGIDSSAVLALSQPQLSGIHTFTALSGGTRDNGDAENSEWIAREFGVPNHQVVFPHGHTPTPAEWARLLWLTETPLCGPEVYYKHELHRFARSRRPQLRGMLLGAASDEFNGGYSRNTLGQDDWDSFITNLGYLDRQTRLERHPGLRLWQASGHSLISEDAFDEGGQGDSDVFQRYVESEYVKIQQYNVWHEDRTAAGSGIEARVPFLDHRLVELTAVIPPRLRPRLLWDKRILRAAMASRVPALIAERPKEAFFYGSGTRHAYGMLVRLMRANDHELVQRALAAPEADRFINASAVHHLLTELGAGNTDSPVVELLLRVVNMGLLAEMAQVPPDLDEMPAGALPYELTTGSVAEAGHLFTAERDYAAEDVLAFCDGVLLLRDIDGTSWFLLKDGQIEYVFEEESSMLLLLRAIDGKSLMADVLTASGTLIAEVRTDLDELLDQGLLDLRR